MSIIKQTKDQLLRWRMGKNFVPTGLFVLSQYFRANAPITFTFEKQSDGLIIAKSNNFRYGSIITSAPNELALDANIKDAILTAFQVPSSYSKKAGVKRVDEKEYAF